MDWEEFVNYIGLVTGFILIVVGLYFLTFSLKNIANVDLALQNTVLIIISAFALILGIILLKNSGEYFKL